MKKNLHAKTLFSILFFATTLLLSNAAFSQKTWDGGASTTNWGDGNNWNPNGVPASTDDVIISGVAVTMTASGNAKSLTINSGASLYLNAANITLTIANGGSVTVNGTLQFNVTGRFIGGAGGPNGIAVTIASGATLITSHATGISGSIATTAGNKTQSYSSSANYTFDGAAQTISGNLPATVNNLTLSGSGSKTLPSSNLNVTGSFTVSGSATITPGTGTVTFNGTAAQTIPSSATFYNLNISNTFGVTLAGSASVSNTLTLTNGLLNIPTGNTLTLASGAAVAGGSFSNTKHIATLVNTTTGAKGVVQVNGISGSYTFPVGNGTYYLPATVTPTGSANFSVTAFTGVTTNGEPNGTATSRPTLVDAVWNVTKVSGSGTPATLTLGWPAALERGSFIADDGRIGIAHYSDSKWDYLEGSPDGNNRTATRSGLTSFSPFIVGYILADITLPVRFTDVQAAQVPAGTQIGWSNATEENVQEYVVERSTDGRNYTALSTVAAGMNNHAKATYDVLDQSSLRTEAYYRIKAVEHNGKATYSAVVKVSAAGAGTSLNIFPNPVTGNQISFTASNLPEGKYSLSIYTAAGQLLSTRVLNHKGGFISQTLGLNGAKAGQYVLEVNGAVRTYKHLVIQ